MGKEFTEERGNLPLAPQFVCGPPSTSRARRKRRASREGVHGRYGKPSPCPPLCLRAAPLPSGRAKNGREAGKEFAGERENVPPLFRSVCALPLPRSQEKMGGRRVGRSRKKGGSFPCQYVSFAGLAKNGSRAGEAFATERTRIFGCVTLFGLFFQSFCCV